MIKKIKKHKNKLFILMLSLISALTLFLNVGKTYAYDTNQFSYTISSINSNYNVTTNNNITTIDNINGNITDSNLDLIFNLNNIDNTYNTTRNLYLLINFDLQVSNDNITYNEHNEIIPSTSTNYRIYTYLINSQQQASTCYNNYIAYYTQNYNSNKNYHTAIYQIEPYSQFDNHSFSSLMFRYTTSTIKGNSTYFKFNIYNIDIVYDYEIGLSKYYETYYGQIEDNYNTLLNNYNDLQDNYTTLEGNYNTLENNYNTLEDNYNTLNGNINNLNEFYKYGFIGFMKNGYISNNNVYSSRVTLYYTNNDTNTISIKEYPLSLNDISSFYGNNTLSLYDLVNNYIELLENSIDDFTDLYYVNECNLFIELQSLYNIEYIDFTNVDFTSNMELFIRNSVDNIGVYFNDLNSTNVNINSTIIEQKNVNLKQFNTIEFDRISFDSDVYKPSITLNNVATSYYSNGFNNGYQSGLQQAYNSQQTIIDDLNSQINSLNSQITDLQNTISLVQSSNEQLRNELSTLNENNMTWQKMFFTMADTPLKTVSSVLGKDVGNAFLGINLYDAFIGLVTTLAIIWLIKRLL